jgi:hypothetical protein
MVHRHLYTTASALTSLRSSVIAIAAAMFLTTPSLSLSQSSFSERCSSTIFEISSRHLNDHFCAINDSAPGLEVNMWCGYQWNRSSLDQVFANPERLTIVYVHGNFMERENTRERVRILDSYLKRQAKESYNLLLFSWPSAREKKPLRDAADNAKVAEMESLYVAWILRELRSHPKVSLIGFSYGCRTVASALHIDAGGSVPGLQSIEMRSPRTTPYRLGLIAPAVDKTWLTQSGRYSQALENVEGFVNLYNSRDPVLRRFRFIDRVSRPIAGGLTGFDGLYDPRSLSPLVSDKSSRQYDCGSIIGTTHSEKSYYGECPYFRLVIDNVLWNEPSDEITCSRCQSK